VEGVGLALHAERWRVAVGSARPSSVRKRWVFSIVTVESSTSEGHLLSKNESAIKELTKKGMDRVEPK
jgi:hypothetical protein